jgi:heme exporter protein D
LSFATFSEFLDMGGHGLYVWLCYGVGLILFITIFIQPRLQRRAILKELAQRYRRQELRNNSSENINNQF